MAFVESNTKQMVQVNQGAKVENLEKKRANKDLQKTRLCIYNLEGKCGYGANCTFAHSTSEVKDVPNLAKTQLCAKFAEGKCTKGANCTFAHGEAELKDTPNFKKKLCKWFGKGNCRNGTSCGFAHSLTELRTEVPAPPGFEQLEPQATLSKMSQKIAPPPGLTKMSSEDCEASTGVPSSQSQAESELTMMASPPIPEEHLFRFLAGRGSAPLQHQVALMNSAIGGLQAKLSQLEDMMLQSQVTQMQQQIEMLTEQCWSLENGLCMASQPVAPTPLRSRLNAQATPFKPSVGNDWRSDDSTSVGSE